MAVSKSMSGNAKLDVIPSVVAWVCLLMGLLLMTFNLYGLTQPIRMPGLGISDHANLRFIPENVWSYDRSRREIESLNRLEKSSEIIDRANRIVHKSLVHIDWKRVDPREYRQLVPIWENYFLFLIGRFSGLPQFERYHFSNFERNIERGIGICGDASTVLSSILDRHRIPNRIISFDGHVLVEVEDEREKTYLADPDFGLLLNIEIEDLATNPQQVRDDYLAAGYSEKETDFLLDVYGRRYRIFDDTYHFMRLRYLFERISYVAKWLLPLALFGFAFWLLYRVKKHRRLALG